MTDRALFQYLLRLGDSPLVLAQQLGAMAGLEPDEQRRLLALRGLRATDQVAIERLQTHSRQSLTELGEQREGLARHR